MKKELTKSKIKDRSNIHDLYYKDVFSNKIYGLKFLKFVLTPSQFDLFNWDTLHSEMETLVSPEGRERRTDLIFSVRPKGGRKDQRTKIIFLIEHKAQTYNDLLFQLLEYQSLIYKKEQVPIIPIVFYHGKTKSFNQPLKFHDALKGFSPSLRKKFGKHILSFEPILLNIHDFIIGQDKKTRSLAPTLFILQKIWNLNKDILEKFFVLGEHLNVAERKWQVEKAVDYIHRIDPHFTWKIIASIEEKIITEEEERIMPPLRQTLDEVREEGEQRGRQKGRQEGRQEGRQKEKEQMAVKLLREGTNVEFVKKITGLSQKEIEKLKK